MKKIEIVQIESLNGGSCLTAVMATAAAGGNLMASYTWYNYLAWMAALADSFYQCQ